MSGRVKMLHDFAPKLADLITGYSTQVSPGDFVVIISNTEAAPLVEALYEAVVMRGANPSVQLVLPSLSELLYKLADGEQLDFLDPIMRLVIEKADVILQIESPSNMKSLASSDPAKMARRQQANRTLLETQIRRIGDKSLRWCLMPWPTPAAAQQSDMGFYAYRCCT